MLCREFSLVKHGEGWGIAIPLVCRAWNCDYCAPGRRRQLIDLAKAGAPNRLVTLTVSPKVGVSPADRAARLARAWRITVARAKRQLKLPSIDYLAVFEATKRGEPHLHILCRCGYIPQKWLSTQLADILGSPIVDIRQVKSIRQAAVYVAKYIGKAPNRFGTCKRYWHTRNWSIDDQAEREEPSDGSNGWKVDERNLGDILHEWQKARLDVSHRLPHWMPHDWWKSLDQIAYGQPPPRAAPS